MLQEGDLNRGILVLLGPGLSCDVDSTGSTKAHGARKKWRKMNFRNLGIQQRPGSYFLLQLGVLITRPCLLYTGQSTSHQLSHPYLQWMLNPELNAMGC